MTLIVIAEASYIEYTFLQNYSRIKTIEREKNLDKEIIMILSVPKQLNIEDTELNRRVNRLLRKHDTKH